MRFLKFVNDHLGATFVVLLLAAALGCWLAVPAPAAPVALKAAQEGWTLPQPALNESRKHVETILVSNLWGPPGGDAAAAAAAAAPPPPKWSILGIARNGAERFVLLAYEGKPAEILKVGDTLPDGARVAQIEDTRFFVLTPDNKKLPYGMYRNEPQK